MGAIGFVYPAVLGALVLLPVIWWLLRLIPPRPQTELFPPLRILAQLVKKEETPAKSPWWLTAMRLALTALVILALARPLLNPQGELASGDGPLLIMIDNDWAAVGDWDDRIRTAEALLRQAADDGRPVALAPTVAAPTAPVQLTEAATVAQALAALEPVAARVDRTAALDRLLAAAANAETPPVLAMIDNGVADVSDADLGERLAQMGSVVRFSGAAPALSAITGADNRTDGFAVTVTRMQGARGEQMLSVQDARERPLGQAPAVFGDGAETTVAVFDIPFELRNDIASVRIDAARHAGAVHLLDENNRRRRVALLTGQGGEEAQPLLSPLFYITRALSPFADLVEPRTGDLSVDVPEMIDQGPAMIIMADIGVLPESAADRLDTWIEAGGTLVRFAGPRLAGSAQDDAYLPVTLRAGERALGGALSWTEPQPVAGFSPDSPFAGLEPPQDVTVTRQLLAQPDIDLAERTWASLADGTPLVTGARRGDGAVVLFHVTAEATWSNLPISGTFVDMLRRITDLSRNTVAGDGAVPRAQAADQTASLAPMRMLRADGVLTVPGPQVRPFDPQGAAFRPDFENPAGLYGTPEGFIALNLMAPGETLAAFAPNLSGAAIAARPLVVDEQADLSGWLHLAAFLILIADTLAVLWINGRLGFDRPLRPTAATTTAVAMIACALALSVAPAMASDAQPGDATILDVLETTRMAYVITGDPVVDDTSRAGLDGLARFLASRTAFEPGAPMGVDIEVDELAFYPLIYFPMTVNGAIPTEAAVARLDAYMQGGGTVLFDTRDQLVGAVSDGTTPETSRLRAILGALNVPPLEPVPSDHVLTKAFYILDTFPGRYGGSPLWVEAQVDDDTPSDRPVRTGDGVTPIMITGNDFAAAWALDEAGTPMFAMGSGDPLQRIYAFRTGVNIMMYMLTGNYKADQVHVPALLERLGQ